MNNMDLMPKNMRYLRFFLIVSATILLLFAISRIFSHISFNAADMWDANYYYVNIQMFKYAGIALLSIFVAFYVFDKRLGKSQYFAFLIPLLILISGKGQALIAVGIFLLADYAIGAALLDKFKLNHIKKTGIYPVILATFMGLCVNSYIVWLALHFRVNIQPAYYLFFLSEIFISWRLLATTLLEATERIQAYQLSLGQKAIILSAFFALAYALVPFYGFDNLIRHFYLPKYVTMNGIFPFDPRFVMSLDLAVIPQSSYISVFLMGGEYAIRLLNYLLIFMAFSLIEDFARKRFNEVTAFYASLAGVMTPFILWLIGDVHNDSFILISAAIISIFIMSIIDDLSVSGSILYFILIAFSFLCKQQAIYIIIPSCIILAIAIIKKFFIGRNKILLTSLLFGPILSLILLLPFLVQNIVLAGNPFLPFYNGIFRSEWFRPYNFIDTRWLHPLNWRSLYELTFNGNKYVENVYCSFGITYFIFLLFSPLIFINKEKRRNALIIFFIFATSVLLWFQLTGPYMRYFIACLPIGSIMIGMTISAILDMTKLKNGDNKIVLSIIIAVFVVNFLCMLHIGNMTEPYPLKEAFTNDYEGSNLRVFQYQKKIFDYTSVKYGPESKCLLIDSPAMYFAGFKVETLLWYHYKTQQEILAGAKGPKDIYDRIFLSDDFDYIIMPENISRGELAIFEVPDFRNMLRLEYAAGGYGLYLPRIKGDKSRGVFYDLNVNINRANIIGKKSMQDNIWGSTVAMIMIDGKQCIFAHPYSSVEYKIALPNNRKTAFKASVGYHPVARDWNVSDGTIMKVGITSGSRSDILFIRKIKPKDRLFNIEVALDEYDGKNVVLTLSSYNDKGNNSSGDWAVWYEPRIVYDIPK